MIAGIFHQGSGIGNQLHRYVATRVLAEDKGYKWCMVYNEDGSGKEDGFKALNFMTLDLGEMPPKDWAPKTWQENKILDQNGVDIRGYDPEINFVQDNTIIDGEFQDERYFKHRLDDVREWLRVEPLHMRPDLCVIGYRGGEYAVYPDLYLTREYWENAVVAMRFLSKKGDNLRFEVHTDDPESASAMLRDLLPEGTVYIKSPGTNWRSMRYAKYSIISNSSFYILPTLLNQDVQHVIAPRYWARRNTKTWALPQNYYSDKRWLYV